MITTYYRRDGQIRKLTGLDGLRSLPVEDLLWIDLNYSGPEERAVVEEIIDADLQNRQQAEEIEFSSRYHEYNDLIFINSNFLNLKDGGYTNETVSFVLKNDLLISFREADLKSFADTVKKFKVNPGTFSSGYLFLIALFETRIDLDADLLEELARKVTAIGKRLKVENQLEADVLLEITAQQEMTMVIRENIVDNQRVVTAMLRSENLPQQVYTKLRILIKDINSLLDHSNFSFERLEYLQNTFMGLVDLEQNRIVKIFTVLSVIFLPPTLIASIYGMNFRLMPELQWEYGYIFAICLMILSSLGTWLVFKKKRWL